MINHMPAMLMPLHHPPLHSNNIMHCPSSNHTTITIEDATDAMVEEDVEDTKTMPCSKTIHPIPSSGIIIGGIASHAALTLHMKDIHPPARHLATSHP